MEENNTSIFAQAKIEYTQQLIDVLTPNMFDGIKSIYDESKVVFSTQTNQSILNLFRTFLEKVPEWNNELVEVETERIIKESRCDWLDDLVTAVFISHTKILTSIGPNMKNTRVNLTIPKTINFVHKCYINLAREIWKNPYLYDESQNFAKELKAACTPDFYLFSNKGEGNFLLYYHGQLDNSRPSNNIPLSGEDLRSAVRDLNQGNSYPANQMPSLGCNIKWTPGKEPSWFK